MPPQSDFSHGGRWDVAVLALLACVVLLPGLGQNSHWASRESRHAEIIREMALSGDFLVPQLLGQPYHDKPPVMHIPAALLARWTGEATMGIARLPSAMAGILGVLATYGLGRVMYDRRVGVIAAITVLAFPGYFGMAHQARPDMILGAAILCSCLSLALGMRQSHRGERTLYFALAGLATGLGVITKGPYGLLFPVLFAVLAPIRRPDWKLPRWGWIAFALAMTALIATWVVPVYLRDHGAYLKGVIFQPDMDVANEDSSKPFYYYLLTGPLVMLPMFVFLPWAIRDLWRQGYSAPLAIAGAMFLILSCVPKKRPHYLVPVYPFLALAIADSVVRHSATNRALRLGFRVLVALTLVAIPLYYAVFIGRIHAPEEEQIAYAKQLREAVGPSAHLYLIRGHEEAIAWVWREHTRVHRLRKDDPLLAGTLRTAPAGSFLLVPKRKAADFLASVEPLPRELVREIDDQGETMILYRLGTATPTP